MPGAWERIQLIVIFMSDSEEESFSNLALTGEQVSQAHSYREWPFSIDCTARSKCCRVGSREATRRQLSGAASGRMTCPIETSHMAVTVWTPQPGQKAPDKLQLTVRDEKTKRERRMKTYTDRDYAIILM